MKIKKKPKNDDPESCFLLVYYIKALDVYRIRAKGSGKTLATVLASAQGKNFEWLEKALEIAVETRKKFNRTN